MPSINDSRCVLVIGATSGIGRALALSISSLPSHPTVIVTGRRQDRLNELAELSEKNGRGKIVAIHLDINTPRDPLTCACQRIIDTQPEIDAVVFSAAVQHLVDFRKPDSINLDVLLEEMSLNYTAIMIILVKCLIPHFLKLGEQGHHCFIIPITSDLAMVPAPWVPNYSASKAALHSLCLSLSVQLYDTNLHVIELSPPLTESELHDHQGTVERLSKSWMSLKDFTQAAMDGLQRGDNHVTVGNAKAAYERFEKGKLETVQFYSRTGSAIIPPSS